MNEIQKEYTRQLIDEYNTKINKLYFKINQSALISFISLGLSVAIFGYDASPTNISEFNKMIGLASASTVVASATCCIKRIVERENLKQDVRMLEYDLAMENLEAKQEKNEEI